MILPKLVRSIRISSLLLLPAALALLAACRAPASARDPAPALPFLHAEGNRLVDPEGRTVPLRGVNAGAWLLIEPWILGVDGQGLESEKEIWDLMEERFGRERKLELIRIHRDNFFREQDVRAIADLGLNCIRLPIWWRAISDPEYGGDIARLDDCIDWCRKHGVYAIIDLHGAPGGQSDQATISGEPVDGALWRSDEFKAQTVEWWRMIAARYKDEPAVAGYDLLNEAMSASVPDLMHFYDVLYDEIRKLGDRHTLILEDGLLGFHRLPVPADMGWENVCYSFHNYPQSQEEAFTAEAVTYPRFNRAAQHYGVPILVGEFNTMQLERGGAELFRRYSDVFDYYGWSWTFWTYKRISDDGNDSWGLQGHYDQRPQVNLHTASFEEIRNTFEQMNSSHSAVHPLLEAALRSPRVWRQVAPPDGDALALSLADATILRTGTNSIRFEWAWNPPNAGYWRKDDLIGWRVRVPRAGTYRLGLRMANNLPGNRVEVWVDGVRKADAPLPASGGWRSYVDADVTTLALTEGEHAIELSQADAQESFINLQQAWLTAAADAPAASDESLIILRPTSLARLPSPTPIRVEWFNDPPNFGHWEPGAWINATIQVDRGGLYELSAECATPHGDTTLCIEIDGTEIARAPVAGTGDWRTYAAVPLGTTALEPGSHAVKVRWENTHPEGAGNLRSILMRRTDSDAP